MNYLIILNTLAIIFLLFSNNLRYSIDVSKQTTFSNNTLVGYLITIWKTSKYGTSAIYSIYIPIRNRRKIELAEEIARLTKSSYQNRLSTLHAIFSWLKTEKEVNEFRKNYISADKKIVEELIANFKPVG